jgi:glyoxylase-like metal-dependent hydrolase (beta-lactamase superfamily II)
MSNEETTLSRTQTVRVGDFTVSAFVEREFRLDGGTMFGVIPRVMWEKLIPPDEKNTVPMQTNLFVVTTPEGKKVLLDAGLGDALSDFDRKMYAVTTPSNMATGLAELGAKPEEIDWVSLTHLHTDHANGVFAGDPDAPGLFFPNATYVIQKEEWESANNPNERTTAVYHPNRLVAITKADKLKLVSGTEKIMSGITVEQTGGHTTGHQGVRVESGGETFVYYADIFPSRFHVKAPFVASVDTHPLDTLQVKKKLLKWCREKNAVIGFDHDTEYLMGRLIQGKKWLDVGPV